MYYSGTIKGLQDLLHRKVIGMLTSTQYRDNPEVYGLISEREHLDEMEYEEKKKFMTMHQGDNQSFSA
jgi:hypothetical protein